MKIKDIRFFNKKNKHQDKHRGDALILTMFIMAGMLIVALSGSYVALMGIKAAGVQSQSTKAYYVAEAGAEHLLYLFRHESGALNYSGNHLSIMIGTLNNGGKYEVYYKPKGIALIFNSVGTYHNSSRSVQIRMQ